LRSMTGFGCQQAGMIKRVSLHSIVKHFPGGVAAVDGVSLGASAGEVHVILGENGAGKTTLMRVLAGLNKPSSGHVEIDGRICRFAKPQDAKRHGIGMVHQHFSLVNSLSVAENLALGRIDGGFFLNPAKWSCYLSEKAEECGLDIRPDTLVGLLSLGERQRVEIFRLIVEGAKVLILDEPTSILAPQEAELLFDHIRRFSAAGHIIFLVTHKIHHVRAVGQKLSILRRGKLVRQCAAADLADDELASLMVGEPLASFPRAPKDRLDETQVSPVLDVRDLNVSPLTSPDGMQAVSFHLQPGEILGVAGISGNGQDELVGALTGRTAYRGTIKVCLDGASRRESSGIGYIPGDRRSVGSALSLSVMDNLALRRYDRRPFSSRFLLNIEAIRNNAIEMIGHYDIHPKDPLAPAWSLSGGNLQKVILARELEASPRLVIAVNPTAGLDVATVGMVHRELMGKARNGTGILYVSEDLDELFLVCDRILVLRKGKVEGVFCVGEVEKAVVALLMSRGKLQSNEYERDFALGCVDRDSCISSRNVARDAVLPSGDG